MPARPTGSPSVQVMCWASIQAAALMSVSSILVCPLQLRSGDGVEDVQGHRRNEYDLEQVCVLSFLCGCIESLRLHPTTALSLWLLCAVPLPLPPSNPALAPQVLPYGLDDDQHCVWLSAEDQGCMPSAYILHPDYLELVRRLPDGTGEPGPDNTVQLGDNQQQGQGQGQASSWEAVAAAAKQKEEPHILFLGAIPDLTPGSMPPEEGEEDTWWTGWVAGCGWAHDPEENLPPPKARRRLGELRHGWQHRGGGLRRASQRHLHSESSDL